MQVQVSGHHLDVGDALRTHATERLEAAVTKYFDRPVDGQVTFTKQGHEFRADCSAHLSSGLRVNAQGAANEVYASFEAALERLEKRLRRYKRRLKSHHANGAANRVEEYAYRVLEALPEDEDEDIPEDYAPLVIAETKMGLSTMPVSSAVLQLDLQDTPVYVFRNAGSGDVNLVYRRPDGHIGWIDPGTLK
ncbi:MAG: ribosome-associated translation inhibitor RaiA [Roseitalea porphyridii]|uniref:ribosome hibernation-promoting factor, HPF/YfiA family n=1 Tax=Roseitalea porphyridii TaxID=1852022 RepID=UPI0032EEC311